MSMWLCEKHSWAGGDHDDLSLPGSVRLHHRGNITFNRRMSTGLRAMRLGIDAVHSRTGCPGGPPEQLIKAALLQAFYAIM